MHTYLMISGDQLIFSDAFPGQPVSIGNNVNLTILSKNLDEMKSQFHSLKAGGKVEMDLQETAWSKCYGMLVDKFGICWQFSFVE